MVKIVIVWLKYKKPELLLIYNTIELTNIETYVKFQD